MDLRARSVEVILAGQSPSGGYVACPNFEVYRYSWLRDGCFIADAMREVGEVESADRFFDWCARVVLARPTGPWDARYTLDGEPDTSAWPKLQTDGLGLLLWALRRRGDTRAGTTRRSTSARGSSCTGREPCIDWWEEREGIHASTLWCIGDGLDSDEIRREALARADDRLDASQLFIGTPELVARVEEPLVSPGGGVRRNLDDEYYGGGEWLLLTAMLGLATAGARTSDVPRVDRGARGAERRPARAVAGSPAAPRALRAVGREVGRAGLSPALVACDVPSTAPCPPKPCAARSSVAGSPHSRRTRRCGTAGCAAEEIVVFGTHEDPTEVWRTRAASIRQQRMRSESRRSRRGGGVPGARGSRGCAPRVAWRRSSPAVTNRYHPRVDDFLAARRIACARESGWEQSFRCERVERDHAGRRRLRRRRRRRSATCSSRRATPASRGRREYPGAVHAYEPHDYAPKVAVVGAGMAAATEWLNALAAGSEVVSIRRREPLRRALNVPRAFFSKRGLAAFHASSDERRAATLRELSTPSYPAGSAWDEPIAAAERASQFRVSDANRAGTGLSR